MDDLDALIGELSSYSSPALPSSPRVTPPSPLSGAARTTPLSSPRTAPSLSLSLAGSSQQSPRGLSPSGTPTRNASSDIELLLSSLETEMASPRHDPVTGKKKGSRIGSTVGLLMSPRRSPSERLRDLSELTNLASDERSTAELIDFDAQLCFEQALRRQLRDEVVLAAQGMTNLASTVPGRNSIRAATIAAALDCIVQFASDEDVQVKLLGALVNLCFEHSQNRQFLVDSGLFSMLAAIIHRDSHNSAVLNRALSLLTNVLSDAANQETLRVQQPGLPALLVRAAVNNDHDAQVMDVSLKVFSLVSRSSPASQRMWVDAGLVRILPRCLTVTESAAAARADALRAALATVVNFSSVDTFVRDVQAAGCIPVLSRLLAAGSHDQRDLVAQALQNLSADDSCAHDIHSCVGAAPLVSLLQNSAHQERLAVVILKLLQNLAATPAIRASLNAANATAVVQSFLDHHAVPVKLAAKPCHDNLTI